MVLDFKVNRRLVVGMTINFLYIHQCPNKDCLSRKAILFIDVEPVKNGLPLQWDR